MRKKFKQFPQTGYNFLNYLKVFSVLLALLVGKGVIAQTPSFEEVDRIISENLNVERTSKYELVFDNTRGFQYGKVRFDRFSRKNYLPKYNCENNKLNSCRFRISRQLVPEEGYDEYDRLYESGIKLVPLIRLNSLIRNYKKQGLVAAEQHCNLRITEDLSTGDAKVFVRTSQQRLNLEDQLFIPEGVFTDEHQGLIDGKISIDSETKNITVEAILLQKRGSLTNIENETTSGLLCRYEIGAKGITMTSKMLKDVNLKYWRKSGSVLIDRNNLDSNYTPFSEIKTSF